MENEKELINRFEELSSRAFSRGCYTNSYFLSTAEQALLSAQRLSCEPKLWGGFEGAERRIAIFGNEDICGYSGEIPINCVKISAVSSKFSDDFSHRDFLGAIMNLGLKRDRIGDIIIKENVGYVFCIESAADYIIENLDKVRHTTIVCEHCSSPPNEADLNFLAIESVVSSPRLDSIISAVFKISRSEAKNAVEKELVAVNSITVTDPAKNLLRQDRVSFRGFGKFIYNGILQTTKKDRLRIEVLLFK